MKLLINNKTKYKISKQRFKKMMNVFIGESKDLDFDEISLSFLDKPNISEINSTYRGKSEPCTVLSFDYGEILVCPEFVQDKYHLKITEVEEKLLELFLHGLVHISGHEHNNDTEAKKMNQLEKKILKCYYENSSNVK